LSALSSSTQYWIHVQGALSCSSSRAVSPQQFMLPLRLRPMSRAVENGRKTCSASPKRLVVSGRRSAARAPFVEHADDAEVGLVIRTVLPTLSSPPNSLSFSALRDDRHAGAPIVVRGPHPRPWANGTSNIGKEVRDV
jgi:hypothetical protein